MSWKSRDLEDFLADTQEDKMHVDWTTVTFVVYGLGSFFFIMGSVIGLLNHLGVLK